MKSKTKVIKKSMADAPFFYVLRNRYPGRQ